MNNVDPDTMQDFLIWLNAHESDIANDINDFGDLKGIFNQLFQRNAGDPVTDAPQW